ncbi:acetyl/propionyl/methylcrotonyl-CoA carboxylase subunit alpha [Pseudoclavibacter soli]|uniref:acetyl/propionyl/methylcrotonyl-CoA carboxylase subunit alpha n=1 Tax=Pseudoclavibacter soli TaxID=452623 RepID=UPI000404D071|nr:biotin carboxylase N-terminal domain-containing protein [Pseudoclavibacter soli]
MISRVLIANRGEIAVRIARGCAAYGVASIAVYADADADALHVRVADEAYALPGTTAAETYLSIEAIIAAARRANADAVHPGYGFLSENADFAQAVIDAGMVWIGPRPETIRALGDKVTARRLAAQVGAPLVQGTPGPVADGAEALAFAEEHGLPIAIKAAFGGGGRGLKVAWRLDEVVDQFASAEREAVAAFGRGECFIEQYVPHPRHVEAQVIGDANGKVVVVGTRDCSLQRRNQKVVEEAPAPFLTDEQRTSIESAAKRICEAADYVSAGTVEFLVGRNGTVSFLEVNTRLQVEHPITELTSGVDLVRQQLRVADGLPLEIDQTPAAHGHAIEFRINAEDAGRGFLPSPGRITRFDAPGGEGVRLDSGVVAGSTVSGLYDSLLAKLVVWGRDRAEAVRKAAQALREFEIEGVPTLLDFDRRIVTDPAFTAETAADFQVHTRWIETECAWLDQLHQPVSDPVPAEPLTRTWVEVDGRRVTLGLPQRLLGSLSAPAADRAMAAEATGASAEPSAGAVLAPISGTLVAWKAEDGAAVAAGDVVAVMEAMKMETQVAAPCDGVLHHEVSVDGALITGGARIAVVD